MFFLHSPAWRCPQPRCSRCHPRDVPCRTPGTEGRIPKSQNGLEETSKLIPAMSREIPSVPGGSKLSPTRPWTFRGWGKEPWRTFSEPQANKTPKILMGVSAPRVFPLHPTQPWWKGSSPCGDGCVGDAAPAPLIPKPKLGENRESAAPAAPTRWRPRPRNGLMSAGTN